MSAEPTVVDVANVLLRRWKMVLGLPVGAALLAAGISFLVRPTYTARASFVPESRSQNRLPSSLAGLAGQFGIQFGPEASHSPRFYGALLKSRELVERVLRSRYPDPRTMDVTADSVSLLAILDIEGGTPRSLHRGVKRLESIISVSVDNQTNIVQLRVDARYPALASEVANRLIAHLNEFNTSTRQSQARARRQFTEARLAEAERQLRLAEDELRRFYERNRSWQQSPQLTFEEGKLRRRVDIQQEVHLTLNREYEIARIEEVNDALVITVIEPATIPQERSKPNRRLVTVLAFLVGGVVGVFGAFMAHLADRLRTSEDEGSREFRSLVAQLWDRGRRRAPVSSSLAQSTRR